MSKENTRRKFHTDIECVQKGFANGVAENHPLKNAPFKLSGKLAS